ncbi:MAG: Enoyl-[acyl-carrier-protein] reductase [FMN], partial [uncultured Chloroflexia bacterium]
DHHPALFVARDRPPDPQRLDGRDGDGGVGRRGFRGGRFRDDRG